MLFCSLSAACPRLASATTSKVKEACKCGVKGEKSKLQHKAKLLWFVQNRSAALLNVLCAVRHCLLKLFNIKIG